MATEGDAANARQAELISVGMAATSSIAVVFACYLLFESIAFGLAVGAMMAVGGYVHFPYFLQVEDGSGGGVRDLLPESVHPGAAGMGLEVAGLVALALAFVTDPGATALLAGLAAGILAGAVLSAVLPEEFGG